MTPAIIFRLASSEATLAEIVQTCPILKQRLGLNKDAGETDHPASGGN
jgi:hypothetical protein